MISDCVISTFAVTKNVLICGSDGFDRKTIVDVCSKLITHDDTVLCGMRNVGVDYNVYQWCRHNGVSLKGFPSSSLRANYITNYNRMLQIASHVIVFWNPDDYRKKKLIDEALCFTDRKYVAIFTKHRLQLEETYEKMYNKSDC